MITHDDAATFKDTMLGNLGLKRNELAAYPMAFEHRKRTRESVSEGVTPGSACGVCGRKLKRCVGVHV